MGAKVPYKCIQSDDHLIIRFWGCFPSLRRLHISTLSPNRLSIADLGTVFFKLDNSTLQRVSKCLGCSMCTRGALAWSERYTFSTSDPAREPLPYRGRRINPFRLFLVAFSRFLSPCHECYRVYLREHYCLQQSYLLRFLIILLYEVGGGVEPHSLGEDIPSRSVVRHYLTVCVQTQRSGAVSLVILVWHCQKIPSLGSFLWTMVSFLHHCSCLNCQLGTRFVVVH